MIQDNSEKLSAMIDGESNTAAAEHVMDDLAENINGRRQWQRYHLIGQVMRGQAGTHYNVDLADNVMQAIAAEPELKAPLRSYLLPAFFTAMFKPMLGFAMAASVAVVSIMTWQTMNASTGGQPELLVNSRAVVTAPARQVAHQGTHWNLNQPEIESRLNSYLVNHTEYASGRLQGMLPHVRVVSYDTY